MTGGIPGSWCRGRDGPPRKQADVIYRTSQAVSTEKRG